ncbi:DeoR family myo-inositol catabolism operon transcriptional repressor [Paenibacillus forsythiae]|uniref:DeoR family myo-inositol catabolism operon transcriptional repressor n=1 Tax=Paenibacillus forsythiae TaxID=365616 RepID=A0ABU3H7C0_9BACL|nr:DeoR/GlpR family DNA-binding transcription regulator [Paenibacillus forsythiae]MDT3426732.1 DeoR family myo-inositol catabolism operon transcriptional repressor [Paenibacillus forsythiae]
MLKTKRIKQIQDYIIEHNTVSLDELVAVFDVSKNTIRRDIQELVEGGEVKKVYGGVAAVNPPLISFNDRRSRGHAEKQRIAKAAAEYVADGDIIYIDSGTTTLEMIEYIKHMNLTIITSNLDFILGSLPYGNLNIISTGGVLERKTKSFASFKNMDLLKAYNINKAFMASTGISIFSGVTNSSPLESEIKQIVVERCQEVFLLVDHHKFGRHALMTYCKLQDIDYLVTDSMPGTDYQQFAGENGIKLVIAGE